MDPRVFYSQLQAEYRLCVCSQSAQYPFLWNIPFIFKALLTLVNRS
uniref:Uncharacterized protein n=1 Tax=Anguilla anguilla TaxID=7936 RepID=A0A0E9VJF0_ANGAN